MGAGSVKKQMVKMAVPALVGQIVNLLYNIVDRIYIGHIPEIGGAAIETLTKQIIDGQTLAVDTIAGATYTTYGFTAAVADAVTKAGLDAAAMGFEDKSVVILPVCMRITDKLLKNILHSNDAQRSAVLVDYNGKMRLVCLKLLEQVAYLL